MIRYGAILLSALALVACQSTSDTRHADRDPIAASRALLDEEHSKHVIVVAHRACWAGGAPENSLSAIRRCIALGVDMIEIDVALTADGVAVLMHDSSVDRMTARTGAVSSFTFGELSSLKLRAGAGGPNAALTEEHIPSLRDALLAAQGKVLINLDVKGEVFAPAFEVVESIGVSNQILMKMTAAPDSPELRDAPFLGRTLFMPIIRECNEHVPKNCARELSPYARQYRPFDPIAFEITYSNETFLTQGVGTLTELGGRIWVNTLNPRLAGGITDEQALKDPNATWGRVLAAGANILQTDRPEELIAYLRRIGRRTPRGPSH